MAEDECILCNIGQGKIPAKRLFEDDELIAVLDVNGSMPGHAFIFPKEHHTILEQVPDKLLQKIFSLSNKVSSSLFDTLNIQGTNIFIANGIAAGQVIPHFMIQIVPRNENDGINLQWPPKQLSEEEMSTVEIQLKEDTKNYVVTGKSEQKAANSSEVASISDEEEDLRLKVALRKIP